MTTIQNANDRPGGVTSDGRLMIETIDYDYSYHVCAVNEMAYTMYLAAVTPTGAADVFFTIINTHDRPCEIREIRYYDAHAGEFLFLQTGPLYALGTTHAAIEPINRKVGSTLLASSYATIEQGVDITGDTNVSFSQSQAVQNTETTVSFEHRPLVLAQNRCFSIEAGTGTGAIRLEVDFMWLEPTDYTDN